MAVNCVYFFYAATDNSIFFLHWLPLHHHTHLKWDILTTAVRKQDSEGCLSISDDRMSEERVPVHSFQRVP